MLLEFHPEALEELAGAVRWHERERPGYGRLLYDEVRKRVAQAGSFPKSAPAVRGFEPRYDVRCFFLRKFKYAVITAIVNGQRFVIAIAHTSREPRYWRDRLKPAP